MTLLNVRVVPRPLILVALGDAGSAEGEDIDGDASEQARQSQTDPGNDRGLPLVLP